MGLPCPGIDETVIQVMVINANRHVSHEQTFILQAGLSFTPIRRPWPLWPQIIKFISKQVSLLLHMALKEQSLRNLH